jgi:TP901 family phage tail tape measure protein
MDSMFTLGVVLSATDMLSPVMGKAQQNVGKLTSKLSAVSGKMAVMGTAAYAGGHAMLSPVMDTVNAYQELAAAQGEVESLGIGANGIDAITRSAKEFSNQFAGTTTPEFLRASYDIKSGISSLSDEAVGEFTALSAMTGAATKSTTADMTKLFALGHGIFRKDFGDDVEFGSKFSGAISGAVQMFRTDGADLSQGISNIGAAASSMGVTLGEELSIIGVAKSSFDSASEAATGYRAFLDNVGKAQKDLGLEFTDSNGKMLPMVDILGKIQDEFGDLSVLENSDELKSAFGSAEAVKLIKGLIDKRGELSQAQETLNGHMQNGKKLTVEMALAMNKGQEFEIMSNQFSNLSSTIGSVFAPVVSKIAIIVGDLVTWLQDWTDENKMATKWIGYIVGGLGALLAVGGSVLIPIAAIGAILPALTVGFTALGTAIGFVSLPVLAIGAAIGVIGYALYTLYDEWEFISSWWSDLFSGLWDKVTWFVTKFTAVGQVFSAVKGLFGSDEADTKIEAVKKTSINGVSGTNSVKSAVSTTNSIKIEVNNPNSDVDVERAVHKAIKQEEQSRRNRSFEDEDI